MKADRPYLAHIADSIAAIETYVAGGRDSFLGQIMIQDAVIRNFEIIGEAADRLVLKELCLALPWPPPGRTGLSARPPKAIYPAACRPFIGN